MSWPPSSVCKHWQGGLLRTIFGFELCMYGGLRRGRPVSVARAPVLFPLRARVWNPGLNLPFASPRCLFTAPT